MLAASPRNKIVIVENESQTDEAGRKYCAGNSEDQEYTKKRVL